MKIHAPRFGLEEARDAAEAAFIEALHRRAEAGQWDADGWLREGRVVISIDLCDHESRSVVEVLRVDFDGRTMLAGPDGSSDLDTSRGDVLSVGDRPPAELASAAADWLEREMVRPLERLEWNRPAFRHRRWRYADTGQELSWSDSENHKRADLGPPDLVARFHGTERR